MAWGETGGTKTDPSAKKKRKIIIVQAEKESLRNETKKRKTVRKESRDREVGTSWLI